MIVSTGEQTVRIPARGGLEHARGMLRQVAPDAARAGRHPRRPRRGRSRRCAGRRGGAGWPWWSPTSSASPSWERTLRALSARHELLAVEVLDPRELELPEVGTVVLADPETGRQREVVDHAAAVPGVRRGRVRAPRPGGGWRCAGAGRRTCGCAPTRDWVADVVRFVLARKRTWSGGGADVPVNGVFTDALVAAAALAVVRRWPSATSLLLRRRRRDTRGVHEPGAARPGRPEPPGPAAAPPGRRADPRADPAHGRVGGPDGRGAGAAQPGHRRAGDRRVAVDAGHGRGAEPAGRGAGGGEVVRRPADPGGEPRARGVRGHGGGAGVADDGPRARSSGRSTRCSSSESTATGEAIFAAMRRSRRSRKSVVGHPGRSAARPDRADERRQADRAGARRRERAARGVHRGTQGRRGEGAGVDDLLRHRLRLDRDRRRAARRSRWTTRRCGRSRSSRAGSSSPPRARASCGRSTPSSASRSATRCGEVDASRPWLMGGALLLVAGVGAGRLGPAPP